MFRSAFTNTFRSARAAEVARTFVGCASKNQLPKLAVSKHPQAALMKARSSESLRITKHSIAASARFMSTVAEGESSDKSKLNKASVPEIQNHQKREVLKYPNGFVYEGEMAGGQPHGQGKITLRDGKVFEGEFVNGVLQGQPRTLTTLWYHYEGDVLNGEPHGMGKKTLRNGQVWEGEYCESARVGKGKIIHPDGKVVEGEFRNNGLNGFCVIRYTNGDRKEGKVIDNQWEGVVKHFFSDGEIHEDYYVKGDQEGPEKIIRADGSVVEGEYLTVNVKKFLFTPAYSYRLRHGLFKYTHPSGRVEEGEIKYDMRVGRWKYIHLNGATTTEEISLTVLQKAKLAFAPIDIRFSVSRRSHLVFGFFLGHILYKLCHM